jgi:hypothetical protein
MSLLIDNRNVWEKTDLKNRYNISRFLLHGIKILEFRESQLGNSHDDDKERRFGRHLAGTKLAHLNRIETPKQKVVKAISIFYRENPESIDERYHNSSYDGYLSRLEEEFL